MLRIFKPLVVVAVMILATNLLMRIQEHCGNIKKKQKSPSLPRAFLHENTLPGSKNCFTSSPASLVCLIQKSGLFPIRRTFVVLVYVAVPLLIGHRRPMVRVEPRCRFQSLLRNIKNVFVFRHVVLERAERDCEQLLSPTEKVAKRNDDIRDLAGTGVDDYFLDVAEALVFGIDHVCACLLYTSPSPRDGLLSRMPSSA